MYISVSHLAKDIGTAVFAHLQHCNVITNILYINFCVIPNKEQNKSLLVVTPIYANILEVTMPFKSG